MAKRNGLIGLVISLILIDSLLFGWIAYSYFKMKVILPFNHELEKELEKFDKLIPETDKVETQPVIENDISQGLEQFDKSTTEKPKLEEFEWCYLQTELSIPDEAEIIYDYPQILGDWKAMVWFDRGQGSDGYDFKSICNVNISGSEEDASWIFSYSQLVINNYDFRDESTAEDELFTGYWEDSVLTVNGYGNLSMEIFYSYQGREYGLGSMVLEDGSVALVALVRP